MVVFAFVIILIMLISIFYINERTSRKEKAEFQAKQASMKQEMEYLNIVEHNHFISEHKDILGDDAVLIAKNSDFYILASDATSLLKINESLIEFKDLLNFEVEDNSETVLSSTGPSANRAVAVGLLTGNWTAVNAAVRITQSQQKVQSTTNHNYRILITLNSISNPLLALDLKQDAELTAKIASFLTVVINKNKELARDSRSFITLSDKLHELQSLREEGLLTEDEFKEQKQKLLKS